MKPLSERMRDLRNYLGGEFDGHAIPVVVEISGDMLFGWAKEVAELETKIVALEGVRAVALAWFDEETDFVWATKRQAEAAHEIACALRRGIPGKAMPELSPAPEERPAEPLGIAGFDWRPAPEEEK
jgi:hypothetical protein